MRFACVGDVTVDRFSGAETGSRVGGNALNVACWISHLGGDASLYSAVGDDKSGEAVLSFLAKAGVRRDSVVVLPGPTPSTDITVKEDGDRLIVSEQYGVVSDYRPDHADLDSLADVDVVHIGYSPVPRAWRQYLSRVVDCISQDCAVSPGEDELAIAFYSHGNDIEDAIDMVSQWPSDIGGAPIKIVTCGAAGSLGWYQGQYWRQAALETEVVDTTGAGDSFIAGFLHHWSLSPGDIPGGLNAGASVAAQCCRRVGGTPLDGALA